MLSRKKCPFDTQDFLESPGLGKRVLTYARGNVIFAQGDPCSGVLYVQGGGIRLSVLSQGGKEAIVATLGPGDFLGEGSLAGHPVRLETATATMVTSVLLLPRRQMIRLLHSEPAFSDRFIEHMVIRNARLEADLVGAGGDGAEQGEELGGRVLAGRQRGDAGPIGLGGQRQDRGGVETAAQGQHDAEVREQGRRGHSEVKLPPLTARV